MIFFELYEILDKAYLEFVRFPSVEVTILKYRPIKVFIDGEVQNPGLISIRNGSNLTQAILKAGSTLGWRANKNNIELIRMKDNGTLHIKKFSYDIKKGLSKNADIKMVNGDIIRVKTSNLGLLNDSIAVLTNPLKGILTAIALLKIAD